MEILMIRHAPAEERENFAQQNDAEDSQRPLTSQGKAKMRKAAKGINALVPKLDLIATSPYQRAVETGRILHEQYPTVEVTELSLLEPGVAPDAVAHWAQQQQNQRKRIALIGHEPDMGELIGWFLCGQRASFVEFKKGAACLLSFGDSIGSSGGVLRWFLTPGQLRDLAGLKR